MLIVTASDNRMASILDSSIRHTSECGYSVQIYDVEQTMGRGTPYFPKYTFDTYRIPLFKYDLLVNSLTSNFQETFVTWMDADAYVVKRFDEVAEMDDYDIGLTVRPFAETQKKCIPLSFGYINTGVMFFRVSNKVVDFLSNLRDRHERLWETLKDLPSPPRYGDQYVINTFLLDYDSLSQANTIFKVGDVRIRLFDTNVYNWYYWDTPIPNTAKILHLKEYKKRIS